MSNRENYKRILVSGRKDECECCGLKEWQGKELKLQVHHIDGNRKNNDLSNLQLLCPNCHSQTDTWCAKNRKKILKEQHFCKSCGKEIGDETKHELCRACWRKVEQMNSSKPSKKQLLQDCKDLKSYSKVSKKYNVSDKTIKKWCESYDFTLKQLNIKPQIKPSKRTLDAIANKRSYAIYQFDLNEKFIKEYPSISEAGRETKISRSNITKNIRGAQKTAGGFIWKRKYGKQS